MVRKAVLLSIVPLFLLGPPAQAKVPLREAVSRALARSRTIAAQRLNEEASAARRVELEARRAFTMSLGGSLGVASDSPHITAGDMPWVIDRLEESVPSEFHLLSTPRVMADLRLGLRQPILTGGSLRRGIEAEALGGEAESEMTLVLEAKLAADVEASYYRSRILRDRRESLRLLAESLTAHLQKVERLLEAELARRTDVLETRMRIEEIRLSAIDAERAGAEERAVFSALCGLDPEEVDAAPQAEVPPLDEAIAVFKAAHPFFRYVDRKIGQAGALGRAAAGEAGLQLSAFGQAHLGRPGIALFNPRPQFYIIGGLNVDLPLLDAKKRATSSALADIERRKLESRRDEFLRDGERDLRRSYEVKALLEAKAAAARDLQDLAMEDVRLKTRLYEEGQIANLDCLAALSQLERYRAMAAEVQGWIEASKAGIRAMLAARTEEP